jgi:hypothetical protein
LPTLAGGALTLSLALILVAGGAAAAAQAGSPSGASGQPAPAATPLPHFLPVIFGEPPLVDLAINRIEIIQGITMGSAYTVQVAGRPALVRVFVSLTGASSQGGVMGRLTRYVDGLAQDSLSAGPITVLSSTNEGSLLATLNFNLPASWLAAGTSYVFELDPGNTIPEVNKSNNRYPASGQASFNFQNAPVLNVVLVPVHYARPGAPATDPPTGDLSYLNWFPIKVYPLAQINFSVRQSSLAFAGDLRTGAGWESLLNDVTTLHINEDPQENKEYVALVDSVGADGCNGGCIAGIAWINGPGGGVYKSAVAFAGFAGDRTIASPIMTHEMGHNFGRYHSPCGTTVSVDPTYPYANAVLGQWGYDNAAGQLKDPNAYRDYMSYCDPAWTSDFTYHGIFNAWSWISQPYAAAGASDLTPAWQVSGSFDAAGNWQVSPAHVSAVPRAELASGGPLRLELLDGAGHILGAQAFGSVTTALDLFRIGFYEQGFRVAVPVVPGLAGFRIYRDSQLLFERLASGPAPRLTAPATLSGADGARLSWGLAGGQAGVTYRVRASADGGHSWQVLALDQPQPDVTLAPSILKGAAGSIIEVQASDGVRTDTRTIALPQP